MQALNAVVVSAPISPLVMFRLNVSDMAFVLMYRSGQTSVLVNQVAVDLDAPEVG